MSRFEKPSLGDVAIYLTRPTHELLEHLEQIQSWYEESPWDKSLLYDIIAAQTALIMRN